MPEKKTYDEIKTHIILNKYELLDNKYINSGTKLNLLCPKKHSCKISWNKFQGGRRCVTCSGLEKYTYEEVKECIESFGYKLLSTEYINNKQKLEVLCENNHKSNKMFNSFKSGNIGCRRCVDISKIGSGSPNWNVDRTRKMRKRVLNFRTRNINILKDDPNYNNYLNNPKDYEVDHIFPKVAFIDYNIDKKFGIKICKELCNNIENLQIITRTENRKKSCKYNHLDFLLYIQRYEIQQKL